MCLRRFTRACLGLAVIVVAAGCNRTLTPEEAKAKGDAMLKQMSQSLASAQAFSLTSDQEREHVRSSGQKDIERFSRSTTIKRPNQMAFSDKGQDRDGAGWYDGKQLTLVSNREKVWVRGPMPGTLDEALDYVSGEYAIQIPAADLIYSNPYEALMTADTTGGWVNVEQIGEMSCEHLSYQQAVVDWQIWLTGDDRRLPCQLQITYKQDPGQPMMRITFHDFNTAPTISDATFTPAVPEGYNRIKIMRHVTEIDEKLTAEIAKEEGGAK